MFLPLYVNVTILSNVEKVTALVRQRPPSYTDDTLRATYPSLLQQPSYILKEFLDSNNMALGLYGAALPSDTYGMLRLKLMGCLVAIVEDFHAVENVDNMLSRSDIYYIVHVGGILTSSQRRFCSDIFIIFDSVDVVSQLAQLFDCQMSVLISPPPRQPQRLSSADAAKDQAQRTLRLAINSIVVDMPLLTRSDYIWQLALSVRAHYNRLRTLNQSSASAAHFTTSATRSSAALFTFPPPQEGARFGTINVQYDEWSEYIEPVVNSMQEQQRIVNWSNVCGLKFSGDGLDYIQSLRLHVRSANRHWG